MKGTSTVIMVATLVMLISLAIVLGLVLVLLAELYCSLLLRRRRHQLITMNTTSVATNASSQSRQSQEQSAAPPLSSFYAQGVLQAPRSFLFPSSGKDKSDLENQHSQVTQVLDTQSQEFKSTTHEAQHEPQSSFVLVTSPQPLEKLSLPVSGGSAGSSKDKVVCGDKEHLIYICNPIYDNEVGRPSGLDVPFETPDTFPSHLNTSCSPSEGDKNQPTPSSPPSLPNTPPLTPMKKIPAKAYSVCLRDARCLGTSGSDSKSNNGLSSSTSGSPCTSPSC